MEEMDLNEFEGLDEEFDEKSIISAAEDTYSELKSVLSEDGLSNGVVPRAFIEKMAKFLKDNRRPEVPKALKTLAYWNDFEEIIGQLHPEQWSSASVAAMTRYFTAKGKHQALYFNKRILLPRVRDEIAERRQLNTHLMTALHKSQFKVREFLVGLVMPWLAAEDFSNAEARVLSAYLAKFSLPLKFAAPLFGLICGLGAGGEAAALPFSVPRQLVLLTLLKKHYRMGAGLVCGMTAYFTKNFSDPADCRDLMNEQGHMPVAWYQSLLAFLEEYGGQLSLKDVETVESMLKAHNHPGFKVPLRECLSVLRSSAR